jgi:Mce-associated membrane protein
MSAQTGDQPRDRAQLIVAIALVLAVIVGALTVVSALKLTHDKNAAKNPSASPLQASATTALTEGGQLAVDFTSFNYHTLTQDRNETATHLTAAFAKVYLTQSGVTASDIQKVKAISTSKVVATGLQAFSPTKHTATVIVALDDTASNVKSPTGTLQYYRLQVQMVEQNGKWLASNVVLE